MQRFHWFLLLDSHGQRYKETTVDIVSLSSGTLVVHLREAIMKKYQDQDSTLLGHTASSQLVVYKNKDAFSKEKQNPLSPSCNLEGLGETETDALIVLVPLTASIVGGTFKRETHPVRKQRWIGLNNIFAEIIKKQRMDQKLTWEEAQRIFKLTNYQQERKNVQDCDLDFIVQSLDYATKALGDISTGHDNRRLYFIAPILMSVCNLFDEVDFLVEEDVTGDHVRASVHFEFILKHGKKAVCVVLAKDDDLEHGIIEFLLGSEVVIEKSGLDAIYGIVTNCVQWTFLHNLDSKVEKEDCSLRLTPTGPKRDSVKNIVEKIYAMLA